MFLFVLMLVLALLPITSPVPLASADEEIELGSEVVVTGTGSCLNVRKEPSTQGEVTECLPDGARARVSRKALGSEYTWWYLDGHGWAAEEWLRQTAPPEPDLESYVGTRPPLPGIIAYVGEDENVWLALRDGSWNDRIRTDGVPITASSERRFVLYEDLTWSPDGRFLAFVRHPQAEPDLTPPYDISEETEIGLYDSVTGESWFLAAPAGRDFGYPFRWLDESHLWVVDTDETFHGCLQSTFSGQSIQSLDVVTGERELVVRASSDDVFIGRLGPVSPGGTFLAYEENGYCEGGGQACVLDIASGAPRCLSEMAWPPAHWISDHELLIVDGSYTEPPGGFQRPRVFNVLDGSVRPSTHAESEIPPSDGPEQHVHIPVQQDVAGVSHAPGGKAFAFELMGPTRPDAAAQRRTYLTVWVVPVDGSGKAWQIAPGKNPAWQPKALPPTLFVHGCGGGLGTWTDPGWIEGTTEIAHFTAGDASGKLYRGVIPETPAVPAYVLDYHDSAGSIFDLATLLPQAIDKIQEETDAEKVMLATHSMGGMLAQAYVGGLAGLRSYGDDVEAAFMVAPPSRGSFLVNWLTGGAGNALACPQASELGPNSQSISRLRAADLPDLDYSIVSGTRFWIPFVGLNDGVIADGDVGLSSAGYDKRQVQGIHTDVQLLPNTVAALCDTVLNDPCIPELEMDDVRESFRQRYKEDMLK
jgi:pimeloyl-ACP methyl ester carboxylesterase